jgi:hypothetical protein
MTTASEFLVSILYTFMGLFRRHGGGAAICVNARIRAATTL